jgi:hypothetical protein
MDNLAHTILAHEFTCITMVGTARSSSTLESISMRKRDMLLELDQYLDRRHSY